MSRRPRPTSADHRSEPHQTPPAISLVLFDEQDTIIQLDQELIDLAALDSDGADLIQADKLWQLLAQRSSTPEITAASLRQAAADPGGADQVEIDMPGQRPEFLLIKMFTIDETRWGALFIDSSQHASWKVDLPALFARDLQSSVAALKVHTSTLLSHPQRWSQPMMLELLQALDQRLDNLGRQLERGLILSRPESRRPGLQVERVVADGADRTLLIVAPDLELQASLKTILEPVGYQMILAKGDLWALDYLEREQAAAAILDLSLPQMDGLALSRSIKLRFNLPILALADAVDAEVSRTIIESGADDYLVKPFQGNDLLARLQALLQRSRRDQQAAVSQPLTFDELTIDQANRQVMVGGEPINLTPTELELLAYLAQHAGDVLTHDQLIQELWPLGQGSRHSLFVHINRLRGKLEHDPATPRFIVTRWGIGYTFFPSHQSS